MPSSWASCLIAGCDLVRVRVAGAYNAERPLTETERSLVLPFMRLTLLCNATWRFRNFNVVLAGREDINQEARDSYKELADRCALMHTRTHDTQADLICPMTHARRLSVILRRARTICGVRPTDS